MRKIPELIRTQKIPDLFLGWKNTLIILVAPEHLCTGAVLRDSYSLSHPVGRSTQTYQSDACQPVVGTHVDTCTPFD